MARTPLGTPILTQIQRLDHERERLCGLTDRDVVFEIPDDLDKLPIAERIIEIDQVVKGMSMSKVRSFLDFALEIIAAAREGGYGATEGEGLPAWIRKRNRKDPAVLICVQCKTETTFHDATAHEGERKGRCLHCGSGFRVA